ncbi:MAG: hypothetical protein A2965_00260 [Candidatus Levybacteria bacterium RIFCSPLOWO2_01_FULL_40_96]|nr:MAG: hypothetical protein A2965_00260 [Candidatus Levybacteria bacterium RIFCSPLOWO2_01_FULL_40_96]
MGVSVAVMLVLAGKIAGVVLAIGETMGFCSGRIRDFTGVLSVIIATSGSRIAARTKPFLKIS